MKTTAQLLNEVVTMGFERSEALESIDKALDEEIGYKNRKSLSEENLTDELYETILLGFQCEKESWGE